MSISKFYKILPVLNGLKFCKSISKEDFEFLSNTTKKLSIPTANKDEVVKNFIEMKNKAVWEGDKEAENLINTALTVLKGE